MVSREEPLRSDHSWAGENDGYPVVDEDDFAATGKVIGGRRILSDREAAVIRDSAGSGIADRRGLVAQGPYLATYSMPSIERQLQRRQAKLTPRWGFNRKTRCRVGSCRAFIEEGEEMLLFREWPPHPGAPRHGFIHVRCPS